MRLQVVHSADILQGDTITLVLPGFLSSPFLDPDATPAPDFFAPCNPAVSHDDDDFDITTS